MHNNQIPIAREEYEVLLPPFKSIFCASLFIVLSLPIHAEKNHLPENSDRALCKLYHRLNSKPRFGLSTRITDISSQFIGKPYLLGALGEGKSGAYDQSPLYRFDAFDCETYVDTVLALALANDAATFKKRINQIRYREGHVSYVDRNHFTCLDWNQNNQRQGFIKDITTTIRNESNQPVAKLAQALIDKPAWYQQFTTQQLHISEKNPIIQKKRLTLLRQEGKKLDPMMSTIPYIPLSVLFNKKAEPNHNIFRQIPNAAIVEIIRPNWNLSKEIGTHLNVSHLGFAIWRKRTLFFREASSVAGCVVDVPLIEYLRNTLQSSTIKGINIQVVVAKKPMLSSQKVAKHSTK